MSPRITRARPPQPMKPRTMTVMRNISPDVIFRPNALASGLRGSRRSDCRMMSRRSEEHTSELQSRFDLVCRLLLEKKKGQQQREIAGCRCAHDIQDRPL